MRIRGKLTNITQDWQTKRISATFELTEANAADLETPTSEEMQRALEELENG